MHEQRSHVSLFEFFFFQYGLLDYIANKSLYLLIILSFMSPVDH